MKKSRVMFYVYPEVKQEIDLTAKALGMTTSRFLGDMVDQFLPPMRDVSQAVATARRGDIEQAVQMIQDLSVDVQSDLLGSLNDLRKSRP